VFQGPLVVPEGPAEGHDHAPDEEHGHARNEHLKSGAHDTAEHSKEPAIMIWPLIALAVGAALAGFLNWPKESLGEFLSNSPSLVLGA